MGGMALGYGLELLSAVGADRCVRRVGAVDGLIIEDGFSLSPRWPVMGGMALVCGGECDTCHISMAADALW